MRPFLSVLSGVVARVLKSRPDTRIIPPFSAVSSAERTRDWAVFQALGAPKRGSQVSSPWGPQAGFPGRLGLFDFLAAGEFQEVVINFVGQPRISASMAAAQAGAVAAALPGVARTAPAHVFGSAAKYASLGW